MTDLFPDERLTGGGSMVLGRFKKRVRIVR